MILFDALWLHVRSYCTKGPATIAALSGCSGKTAGRPFWGQKMSRTLDRSAPAPAHKRVYVTSLSRSRCLGGGPRAALPRLRHCCGFALGHDSRSIYEGKAEARHAPSIGVHTLNCCHRLHDLVNQFSLCHYVLAAVSSRAQTLGRRSRKSRKKRHVSAVLVTTA